MPFEISPEFKPQIVKLPRFQVFADALLAGCKMTKPLQGRLYSASRLPWGKPRACALGALLVGLGRVPCPENLHGDEELSAMARAYHRAYDRFIEMDNDEFGFAREHIAERIAAL